MPPSDPHDAPGANDLETPLAADAYLERVFAVVVEQARKDPDFARALVEAAGSLVRIAEPDSPAAVLEELAAIAKTEGDSALRKHLASSAYKTDQLKAIAKGFKIRVGGSKADLAKRISDFVVAKAGVKRSVFA